MLTVVKIGGNIIDNPQACTKFLKNFAALPSPKILVHGGGKIATQVAEKLGVATVMVEGRRITDKAMLDVVTMVYGGLVNKQLVAQLQTYCCNAIGLTGADGGIIRSKKRAVGTIDYGFVGDIEAVNANLIAQMIAAGLSPVFAPLTYSSEGEILNTNADTQAQAVATAMAVQMPVRLVYCFEKKGVLLDANNDDSVIAQINPGLYTQYKAEGLIFKGMIPKLDNAFKAINDGVAQVLICHADELTQAVLHGAGTSISSI
jgi:acetylglutamate kinase